MAPSAKEGLHEVVKEKDREIDELRARLEKLEQMPAGGVNAGR